MFENDLEDLVSVEGVAHLATELGVFLDTQGRRVFLPANCMGAPAQAQIFEPGKVVTLHVFRWYAKQEALVALASARIRIPRGHEPERLPVELLPPPEHEQLRFQRLNQQRLPAIPRAARDDARQAVGAGGGSCSARSRRQTSMVEVFLRRAGALAWYYVQFKARGPWQPLRRGWERRSRGTADAPRGDSRCRVASSPCKRASSARSTWRKGS
jgi:hypothetical protein